MPPAVAGDSDRWGALFLIGGDLESLMINTINTSTSHDIALPSPGVQPSAGTSFLVGETLYLRGAEIGDARWATAWRGSPFPISREKAEEQLKKDVPSQFEQHTSRLIACRRDDGQPVGSALVNDNRPTESEVTLFADPALGARGADLQAEMTRLIVPWLSTERNRPVVRLATDAGLDPVVRQAEALGMRPAVRLRDGRWRDGVLHDTLFYELLNPVWVERLGDPGPGIAAEGDPVTTPAAPAPRRLDGAAHPLPENALIGSERLALRPFQPEDAEPIANLLRAESDTGFGHSRFPYSAIVLNTWFGEIGERTPTTDLELAVVRRETGDLIGEVGLYAIDWIARTAESGWWIYRTEERGQGYGTEANLLLLEYAFDRLALNMIWAWVKEQNPRSQAGLRKQGYRDAGRFTWTGFGPEGFENALMFDLLAAEWRAGRGC